MEFFKDNLYHIYNRGNNQQEIFFNPENYIYFLKKIRKNILPYCDILNWCLMPNHFHLLINTDSRTILTKEIAGEKKNILSEGIRNTLSSYSQAINKQNKTSGSLFQQNTKAKLIDRGPGNYDLVCFYYIHQNPYKANLVRKMEDWDFSSFRDFAGLRNGNLANKEMAVKLLGLNMNRFYEESYRAIKNDELRNIF